MPDENFIEIVERIVEHDVRYRPGAYEFMNEAVAYTVRRLQRETLSRKERHVSGGELIQGVAEYAVQQFGPLDWEVLKDWGLVSGTSIGDVVFNMIDNGLLTASENDSREDFNRVPDLKELLISTEKNGRRKKSSPPPIIA